MAGRGIVRAMARVELADVTVALGSR